VQKEADNILTYLSISRKELWCVYRILSSQKRAAAEGKRQNFPDLPGRQKGRPHTTNRLGLNLGAGLAQRGIWSRTTLSPQQHMSPT
jgi:hypothetical protein